MKRLSASKEKGIFWPGALLAEGRLWDESGLDGAVRGVRAGKWSPETSRGHPDRFRGQSKGSGQNSGALAGHSFTISKHTSPEET